MPLGIHTVRNRHEIDDQAEDDGHRSRVVPPEHRLFSTASAGGVLDGGVLDGGVFAGGVVPARDSALSDLASDICISSTCRPR